VRELEGDGVSFAWVHNGEKRKATSLQLMWAGDMVGGHAAHVGR
jgi:hypothetical protein